MRLEFSTPWKSIDGPVTTAELPRLVVLTGRNGAGKTHLLEALSQANTLVSGTSSTGYASGNNPEVRFYREAPSLTLSHHSVSSANAVEAWRSLYFSVQQYMQSLGDAPNVEEVVRSHVVDLGLITAAELDQMTGRAAKRLVDFTERDYMKNARLLLAPHDPLTVDIGNIFVSYYAARERSDWLQWRYERRGGSTPGLTDEEFVALYGPPPWDLLNETLRTLGVEYRIASVPDGADAVQYEPLLTHTSTGVTVSPRDLSSGEQVLLALTLTLYSSRLFTSSVRLPHVLLFDELDARLHPDLVKLLLRIVEEVFCEQHGVHVIMTTHSPTTVALCPEDSLYVMSRTGSLRLKKATRDKAIKELAVGVPTLSVAIENRRQVFVESEDDESIYTELFKLLRGRLDTEISLQFIASGKGGQGNSAGVRHLVNNLRNAGNSTVWGIVDRDTRAGAPEYISYVPERYSIENIVLDPLPLGVQLLRGGVVRPDQMGLPQGLRHYEIDQRYAQQVTDFVVNRVRAPEDDSSDVGVAYVGGFDLEIPKFWCEGNGHQLEARIKEEFPKLKQVPNLKAAVVREAMGDVLGCIPRCVVELFARICTI